MTKPVSISKKPRKQHTPEFRNEALKLAERIGVAAAARELSLYESQLYAWRSKQQQQMSSSIGIKTPKRLKKHHKTDISSILLMHHMNENDY
ncbi:transposase [Escherichia coli]|nr:transposase [Escherichia coli]HBA8399721.1 transposase [Escherichia coli]